MNNFSGALRLTDLNDFIGPSQDCIKPVPVVKSNKRGIIKLEDDGSFTQNSLPLAKQTITLSDCLACSGCVTSAETVLIESQSKESLRKAMEETHAAHTFVATISPQSISSFAYKCNLSFEVACKRLIFRLRKSGFKYIFSSVEGSEISHFLSAKELLERRKSGKTPVLASACPGWICYAEKTQGEVVLPYLSSIRSPQSIMGALVKPAVAKWDSVSVSNVYHIAVMPCFDKKLEASRPDFISEEHGVPEIDLVLSTAEAFDLWNTDDLPENINESFDSVRTNLTYPIRTLSGGGSGGFAFRVLQHVAKHLNEPIPLAVTFNKLRNKDLTEASVTIQGNEFNVAKAYGFRNIQNIIQKIKRGRCKYDYIEVMACPGGCVNGGGQIKLEDASELEAINELYASVAANDTQTEIECEGNFTTSYHAVEKATSALSSQW